MDVAFILLHCMQKEGIHYNKLAYKAELDKISSGIS